MSDKIKITIYQGKCVLEEAHVNVIIDVIRAFTVSHFAFMSGADEIVLVDSVETASHVYKEHPDYLLSGEIDGYKIESFHIGNSPYEISNIDLTGKTLVQKTTNGVTVALASLNAEHVYVTGFTNYRATVKRIKQLIKRCDDNMFVVNLIASHPNGDDDLACAELIKVCLTSDGMTLSERQIHEEKAASRILYSKAAQKFLDRANRDFSILDIAMCMCPLNSDFVMEITQNRSAETPRIQKKEL